MGYEAVYSQFQKAISTGTINTPQLKHPAKSLIHIIESTNNARWLLVVVNNSGIQLSKVNA